jgi:hypothetical protein
MAVFMKTSRCRYNGRMLRADNKAQVVKLPLTLSRMLTGRRYAVRSGRKILELRWTNAQAGAAQQAPSTGIERSPVRPHRCTATNPRHRCPRQAVYGS